MKYKILATSTAKKETWDAVMYYEEVRAGLGLAFFKEVENRYEIISKNPFAYSFIDNKNMVRDVMAKRFPPMLLSTKLNQITLSSFQCIIHTKHQAINFHFSFLSLPGMI